ncbi:MAG: hypothetical protein RLZZ426_165 [Actinomycetota bacterium]
MLLKYSRLRHSNGSVLLWTLGCFFISLLVIMTTISIVSYSQSQRELQHLTDAAAMSAANQLYVTTYATSGRYEDIAVSSASARTAASDWLTNRDPAVRIVSFSISGMSLTLGTSRTWFPFWRWLDGGTQTLTATASVGVDQAAGG